MLLHMILAARLLPTKEHCPRCLVLLGRCTNKRANLRGNIFPQCSSRPFQNPTRSACPKQIDANVPVIFTLSFNSSRSISFIYAGHHRPNNKKPSSSCISDLTRSCRQVGVEGADGQEMAFFTQRAPWFSNIAVLTTEYLEAFDLEQGLQR